MKIRKCMALLLAGGMLAGSLAGCGGNTNTVSSQQSGSAVVDDTASAGQAADASGSQMGSVASDVGGTEAETQTGSETGQGSADATVSQTGTAGQGSQTDSATGQSGADTAASQTGINGQENEGQMPAYVRVWGPVLSVTADTITIDNRSENGCRGELILHLDGERSKVLDGENGYPVELTEVEVDDAVFAYIGQTMTLSLPAQVTAEVVFCDLPDSLRVPEFVTVTRMEQQLDGSYLMTTDTDQQYLVPENCEILPYLTRNLVTFADVQPDSTCLVWCDETLTAKKIVLFAQ